MSEETIDQKRSAKGRWKKGASGNPSGRPSGSRNRSTLFFEELLSGQGEALIQKGIELSLKGDTRALGICWDRLLPPRKERVIQLSLPSVADAATVSAALALVVAAVGEGRITPGEAECVARVLETQMRVVEFAALAERVAELEKASTGMSPSSEVADGSTLDWISRNYAPHAIDSRAIAEEDPELGMSHETGSGEQATPTSGDSTVPTETIR
jgi:Family of unknown function (DUF5681)